MKYSLPLLEDQSEIAPSLIEIESSGITKSESTSSLLPSPVHSGQAPNGELNEKDLGSSSSKESEQSWQAKCSEYVNSSLSITSRTTMPLPSFNAVSIESVIRDFDSGLTCKRSTTISIVCFSCFLSFGGSANWITAPSTRARENP